MKYLRLLADKFELDQTEFKSTQAIASTTQVLARLAFPFSLSGLNMWHVVVSLTVNKYAQRARTIVNRAVINEDPNAKIIRGLLKIIEELNFSKPVSFYNLLKHSWHSSLGARTFYRYIGSSLCKNSCEVLLITSFIRYRQIYKRPIKKMKNKHSYINSTNIFSLRTSRYLSYIRYPFLRSIIFSFPQSWKPRSRD